MAHQGGKLDSESDRNSMYDWLDNLEFNLLELPKPDISVFLHMPFEFSLILKKNREEDMDQNEKDKNHLINAENAFIELAKKYDFYTIQCNDGDRIKTIEEINEDLYNYVSNKIKMD